MTLLHHLLCPSQSCQEIKLRMSASPDSYSNKPYTLCILSHGDMVLHDGGWTRIAHIDMTDTMEVVRMDEDCMKRMLSVRPG